MGLVKPWVFAGTNSEEVQIILSTVENLFNLTKDAKVREEFDVQEKRIELCAKNLHKIIYLRQYMSIRHTKMIKRKEFAGNTKTTSTVSLWR